MWVKRSFTLDMYIWLKIVNKKVNDVLMNEIFTSEKIKVQGKF